jgi:hypothetical protein
MQNKYKIDYNTDMQFVKKKKLAWRILFVTISIISLIIAIYFFVNYVKSRELSKGEEVINDNVTDKTASTDTSDNLNKPDNFDKIKKYYNIVVDSKYIYNFSNEISANVIAAGIESLELPEMQIYIYGEKVPEREAISDDYFDDAVFIGNSQMEGVSIYSAMKNATVLAGKGIMVDTIFTKEVIKTKDSNRITIMSALELKKFGKIYIMLGANELGWVSDIEFIKQYGKVIDKLKDLQPEAKIYVNAIIPVSKVKSDSDKIYNNVNIERFNKLIINMTKEKQVYYVDSKEALADEEGNLPANSTTDGVHFNSIYYEKWFQYLKTHTVKN